MEVEIKVGDTKIENCTLDDIAKAKKILEVMEENIKQKEEEKKQEEAAAIKQFEDGILAQNKEIFEKRCVKIIKTCLMCGSQCKKCYKINNGIRNSIGVFCRNTGCEQYYFQNNPVTNWGKGFVYN